MGYNIIRSEINLAGASCAGRASNIINNLGRIQKSFQELVDDSDFSGEGAEAIKNYIKSVHITTIQAISVALQEYYLLFASYASGLSEYDSSDKAVLNEDCFTELANKLSAMIDDIEIAQNGSYQAEGDVEDLLYQRFIKNNRLLSDAVGR